MNLESFIPIFLAGITAVFIGWVWRNAFGVFLKQGIDVTPEMIEQKKKSMPVKTFGALLASMLIAYVMSYFGVAWNVYDWIGALELGFWCWAGFVAPTMFGAMLWEQKPFGAYLIDVLYWLVAFMVMALILLFTSTPLASPPYDQNIDGQDIQIVD